MKPTYFSNLTAIAILLTLAINVTAEERPRKSEPDSFVKLGDIKGEYKTETSKEELHDLLREYEFLIWEAEADDFFWGNRQQIPIDILERLIWGEESGDF